MRLQQPPTAAKILRSSCLISTTTLLALISLTEVRTRPIWPSWRQGAVVHPCIGPTGRLHMMKSMSPGRLVPKLRLVLGLRTDPGSAEMYQLQELWVANAVIYRCPGARFPL